MRVTAPLLVVGFMLSVVLGPGTSHAKGSDGEELAQLLIELLRAGRAVVAEHQPLINDASKGDKGFTAEFLISQVIDKFKAKTRLDLSRPIGIPQSDILLALLESEREVVLGALPMINRQGISYKGFDSSVFAGKVGKKFFVKTGIRVKLTATDYRVLGNKPDDFEAEVLRMFGESRHPKGQPYAKLLTLSGKSVMRLMDPEYAGVSCLMCHGGPKGERDITGAKKEGAKEGDLLGATSVVLPLR